jgi:hypothetical protein
MASLGLAPLLAHIVVFDSTWQLLAVMLPVPLNEMPVPLPLSAMTQPGAFALISAEAAAVTGMVVLVVSTRARSSGAFVVTVTCTAWLPSPDGELPTEEVAAELESPLRDAILPTALLAEGVEPVEL